MDDRAPAVVIGLVQGKGGAGRSTIATNLAGELARTGTVVLLDCDPPQCTSVSWAGVRRQAQRSGQLVVDTVSDPYDLIDKVFAGAADYVILDGPAGIGEITRAILTVSHLCLVPISPSASDLWATAKLMRVLEDAQRVRKLDIRLVWTRFRSNTRLAQELVKEADRTLTLKQLASRLGYRTAYAEAMGRGLTAAELSDELARNEVVSLVVEIKCWAREIAAEIVLQTASASWPELAPGLPREDRPNSNEGAHPVPESLNQPLPELLAQPLDVGRPE